MWLILKTCQRSGHAGIVFLHRDVQMECVAHTMQTMWPVLGSHHSQCFLDSAAGMYLCPSFYLLLLCLHAGTVISADDFWCEMGTSDLLNICPFYLLELSPSYGTYAGSCLHMIPWGLLEKSETDHKTGLLDSRLKPLGCCGPHLRQPFSLSGLPFPHL